MRYFILLVFSFTLLFSCGTDNKPAPKKVKTSVRAKKPKSAKAKANAAKAKANKSKYWAYMKKSAGLSDAQIASIKKVNKKYAAQTNQLKKSKKWAGKANAANRKKVSTNKTAELKRTIGASWSKWQLASKNWNKANKPKKKSKKKKK